MMQNLGNMYYDVVECATSMTVKPLRFMIGTSIVMLRAQRYAQTAKFTMTMLP